MKTPKLLAIFTITAALSMQLHAQSFLTNGLVAYYRFDNALTSTVSSASTVVWQDGTTLYGTDRFGQINRCLYFPGTNSHWGLISDSTVYGFPGDFSVSFWAKARGGMRNGRAVSSGTFGYEIYRCTDCTGGVNSNVIWSLIYAGQDAGSQALIPTLEDEWHQLVLCVVGSTATLWLDGAKTVTLSGGSPSRDVIVLGRKKDATFELWGGWLDDLRFYNRALSTNEVQQLYAYESQPIVSLKKVVKPSFSNLFLGTNYQLQVSTDLNSWTNNGSPFTPTNTVMDYPQYFEVNDWSQLLFRLQVVP